MKKKKKKARKVLTKTATKLKNLMDIKSSLTRKSLMREYNKNYLFYQ